MDADFTRWLAYAMAKAYDKTNAQGEAIELVKNDNPDADANILWGMWLAIDAYNDIHSQELRQMEWVSVKKGTETMLRLSLTPTNGFGIVGSEYYIRHIRECATNEPRRYK